MKYVIKYSDNWADEMDVCGWGLFSEEEKDNFLKVIDNYFEDACEYFLYVGTNQEIEYENKEDFMNSFEIVEISDEEGKTIKKIFGHSYGFSPLDAIMYMEE